MKISFWRQRYGLHLLATGLFVFYLSASAALVPGHVEAWGYNNDGESTPPPGLDGVVMVAAGYSHSLALLTNGTVVGWGYNGSGQSSVPPDVTNVVFITASQFSAAVKADGTVRVWGYNDPVIDTVPPNVSGIMQVALTRQAVVALRSDGTVVAWGFGGETNVPPGLNNVVQISAGAAHVLAVKRDGSVVGWGNNFNGQAVAPPGVGNVVLARGGQETSMALRSDGTLFKWGGTFDSNDVPAGVSRVIDFQLGFQHALALRDDGTVLAWGMNMFGQGNAPFLMNGVTAISAGGNHNLVVTARPVIKSITPPAQTTPGGIVTLSVTATGEPLSYIWQHQGTNLPLATNATLSIRNVQPAQAGSYLVYVVNPHGYTYAVTSISLPPPNITEQPVSRTVYRGETATFAVTATGFEPLTYQWYRNGAPMDNGTNGTITLPLLEVNDASKFLVTITDVANGKTTSAEATLTVIDPRVSSVTVRPAVDTSIFSTANNPRGNVTILSGTRHNGIRDRGLLRFDISAVPTNATINSALLRMRLLAAPRNPAESTFKIYPALKAWGADATWTNASGTTAWAGAGGVAGLDYGTNGIPGEYAAASGDLLFSFSGENLEQIAEWVNNPAANHGWFFISDQEESLGSARHVASSESHFPPEFKVEYSLPVDTPLMRTARRESTNLLFEIDGTAAWIYRIEGRDQVDRGPWTIVTNAPAGNALAPILIQVPMTNEHRFFRTIRY